MVSEQLETLQYEFGAANCLPCFCARGMLQKQEVTLRIYFECKFVAMFIPECICSVAPNATAKLKGERNIAVADQILSYNDPSSVTLRRPIER